MIISTYIVNLQKRIDRRLFSEGEFANKPQFQLTILKAIENKIPAIGLYRSLCKLVKIAKKQNLPYVLFCEDDHQFTEHFKFSNLIHSLLIAKNKDADLLLGGVSWFDYGVKLEPDLYWINNFTGMQFSIIFSKFYDIILTAPFSEEDVIDKWISNISDNIYLITPFISIQKDFGYSDVTTKNNKKGIINEYFLTMSNKIKSLGEINNFIEKAENSIIYLDDFTDFQIPVYIITMKNRGDRLINVLNQFYDKKEFNVEVVEICETKNEVISVLMSIQKAIFLAKERGDEIIIICKDDHVFTDNYDKSILFQSIYKAAYLGADIILGGLSRVDQVIQVDENLCWISEFYGSQFVIIYNKFFDLILNEQIGLDVTSDMRFYESSPNKYVIHPFISIQKKVDYLDIQAGVDYEEMNLSFNNCSSKINKIRKISSKWKGSLP